MKRYIDLFNIKDSGGLIGMKHTEAILEGKEIPVLVNIVQNGMDRVKRTALSEYGNGRGNSYT